MKKPLRQSMPGTAAFIDQMRQAFGADEINASIRAGLDGQPTFCTSENGMNIGTSLDGSDKAAPSAHDCLGCRFHCRPGAGHGCSARDDLLPLFGHGHPLRVLPADGGKGCHAWRAINDD